MAYQPNPAFAGLFRAFTSDPDSIGVQITRLMDERDADLPLIVSTGADIAVFPGKGAAPRIESFRKSTRGFIELTAVSHLPLALAYLARMREIASEDNSWREMAENLIAHAQQVRNTNSLELWRDAISVGSLAGMERKIVDMIDYTCAVSIDTLKHALVDSSRMSFDVLIDEYFAPPASKLPVPMNDVMFATFGLAYLDIVFRIANWLRAQALDWTRAMVLVSGQSGRPTAGVTWASNNMCHLIWRASGRVLIPEKLLVAPHAPSFSVASLPNEAGLADLEKTYRYLWQNTRSSIDVARRLFPDQAGYRFEPSPAERMPVLKSVDDRDAATARLRRIMEDPSQLLSNCVADYMIDQLHDNGNRPSMVDIPGFTNVTYPDASKH